VGHFCPPRTPLNPDPFLIRIHNTESFLSTSKNFELGNYLKMVGNNCSGSLPARDGGVRKRENAAEGEQKDEQQVGTEVKRGTTQPELEQVVAPHI
jgi:hypothetical protein